MYEHISNTNNDTSNDKSCTSSTIRHISPYYIEQKLLIGNLAKGKKLGEVLGLAGRRNNNNDTNTDTDTDTDTETNTDTPSSKTINDNDNANDYVNDTNSNCTKTSIARSSIVKNKTLIDWWPKELVAGRLTVATNASTSASASASSTIFVVVAAKEDYIIQDGDILVGRYHFHEQSILYHTTPTTVYEDSNFIIVNKPGGIDCLSNPDGNRVLNSLPGIMLTMKTTNTNTNTNMDEEKTVIIPPPPIMIMPAHRIDNVVSGLVCCGKTNRATKHLSQRIYFKQVTKTYIARIQIQKDRFCTRTDGNMMSCSV